MNTQNALFMAQNKIILLSLKNFAITSLMNGHNLTYEWHYEINGLVNRDSIAVKQEEVFECTGYQERG